MAETTPPSGSLHERLLVALADPEVAARSGRTAAAVVAVRGPLAVLEWLGTTRGLVLLDPREMTAAELAAQLERLLAAHERGQLFVVATGGRDEVAEALRAADTAARQRDQLGFYHLEDSGGLRRIAGRRLPELEKAARDLPARGPLAAAELEDIVERGRRERLEAMTFVRDHAGRFPHVTVAYVAICVLLFILTAGSDPRAQALYLLLSNRPGPVADGELWRLLTYAFLHDRGGITHVVVNMLSLYSLGRFIEPTLGRGRLGALLVGTALVAGVASTLFTRAPSVGASGAVWGLAGATLGLLSGRRRVFPALIARGLRSNLIVVLVLNAAISFLPGIDRYAHFGGGLAGYLMGLLMARRLRAASSG